MGCGRKAIQAKKYVNPIDPTVSVNITGLFKNMNHQLKPGIILHNNVDYLYFLDKNAKLYFCSLSDTSDQHVFNLSPVMYRDFPLGMIVSDSSLFIVKYEENKIEKFNLDFVHTTIVLDRVFSYDSLFHAEKVFIRANLAQPIFINNDRIYIPYSVRKQSTNFTGRNVYYEFCIKKNSIEKRQTIFKYPSEIVNKKRYSKNGLLGILQDSLLICVFKSSDKVTILNTRNTEQTFTKKYTQFSQFEDFNNQNIKDLAYLRLYETKSESNIGMITTDNFIVILKKLKTMKLLESPQYECYVLDSKLAIRNFFKLKSPINPSIMFKYKDGFVLYSKDLNEVLYYSLKNK